MHRRTFLALPLLASLPAHAQGQAPAPAPRPQSPSPRRDPRAAAQAVPPPAQAAPQPDQAALVARAQAALAAMPAFQARFQERSGPSAVATGRIWMDRGRMRVEYDPPTRQLLIANHGLVVHHDPLIRSTSHLPVSSTPLGPLLADPPRLTDPSLLVQEARRQPGILRVRVAQARRPHDGNVEILLDERTAAMQLIGWNLRDMHGREIAVRLADVRPLQNPHRHLFTFLDPGIFGPDANYQVPR